MTHTHDVDTIAAAWYYVMQHLDDYTTPTITITPNGDGYTASIHGNVDA